MSPCATPMLRLRVPVGETGVSAVQHDPAARTGGLRHVREGIRRLDRGMRRLRRAPRNSPIRRGRTEKRSAASPPSRAFPRSGRKDLAAKGFRDFADVVRLALPESAVRQGLHHTIARKVLLADLVPRPQRAVSGARCPMCGAAWLADATRCASCGSTFGLELDPVAIEQRL